MGTRGWTLSAFLGCCTWILHGLGAVAAVPVTTDGSFTVGTALPMTTEDEWPRTTLTTEMGTTAVDVDTFPPWTETDPLMVTNEYSTTVPALVNVSKAPNTTQSTEGLSAAPNTATTAAAITSQHPAVTPETERDELEVPPDVPLGTTPVLEGVKEDILANRGEDTDFSTGTTSLHTTPPLPITWVPESAPGVTALLSQGLTTAKGAVEESVILPEVTQSEASANSSGPSPDAAELLPTQQDGAVGGVEGINPEPAEEMAPAGEESPLASESEDAEHAINGEFSTASSSHLPPESPVFSGTVENPESSLLPGQALSPDTLLTPSSSGDGDGQGVPRVSPETSGSALSPAASRASVAPEETEDTPSSLPAPGIPTDAQSDTNLPISATALPTGDVGAVDLASPSLQLAPWQTPTGEQPLLLPDALASPTDTPSAPGAAYPAPEDGVSTLPEADGAAQTPASPDLGTVPEAAVSPSLGKSQPAGTLAGAPHEPDGLGNGLSSDSDAPSPAPSVPGAVGLAWPTAGIQGQGAEGVGVMPQAGGPRDASPYEDTQSDMSPPALQPSAPPGELLTGGAEDLAATELSPPSALGDGTEAGGAPALGQLSSAGPAPPSSAGMEPDPSGAEGLGDLPSESASAPGALFPPPGSVAGPVSEAETPASPDLSAAQGAPGSPSFSGSQPWGTAAGAPVAAGLPGVKGPDTDSTSAWGTPSSAIHGPAGPPSPGLGDQLGTNGGLPGAEGQGASMAEQAPEGAGSGIESEPSLSSTAAGNGITAGMDQLPSAGSPPGIASPSDVVAAPSVSRGDEAGPISSAAPGPDSLSLASPDGETRPGLGVVQGAESAGDVAQAGNPASGSPNMETSPSAVSPQHGELTGAGSSSGSASHSGDVAASSVSDPSSLGALKGAGSAAEVLQPSLGAGTGVLPPAGEGASEVAGDGGSTGQSQTPTGMRPAGSETLDGETGGVLQSAHSSSSTEGSLLPGRTGKAADETNLPGAAGAAGGLNTGLEASGPQEASVSALGTQSGANTELSDGKLSEVDVVEVPGGALVNGGPSPGASLVPVAPDNSGVSNGMTTSVAASRLLPGRGLSSGLAPNGDPNSAPSTQSGSSPLLPGSPGGQSEEAGGAQSWSLEDEVASGMPAPLGEASPHAPISPNAALVLPSAPQRGNSAEGVSASPGLSARESIVGSSAGGKGEVGTAVPAGAALLLPPRQLGSPGAPSGDADSPVPGEARAVLHGTMAGQGDVTHLLPSAAGSGAHMETHSPPGGSPGLPGLPPAGVTAGSPGAKTLGPGPAGGSSSAALQPFLGRELSTSLANRAPATSGSSLSGAFPGRGGSQGGSPATARPATSCSPALAGPAPPAPLPRGREVLPRPGTATVTSRASSPVVPAPPGVPAAAPVVLPGPAVPAVPLYGYGARENDQEYVERRVDFNSPLFKPETGFPFGKTLHSSLYFTDNGQIIFPASDNSVLTYPNPPPRGFNGHEEVPMIAVFWDNADFSRGVGTTFYQEFSTLNTAKPPFVRDVETKIRRYLRSSYSAAWTLKITWEKAPVHAAWTDTRKTITYQAVLTTDGFRSYILMLYQDGGMQWDYTRLTSTNVLIGYTSGDGIYYNDDLTKRPPAAKYRPDQFRGYNTDLRGLWIYKLESRVGNNYRLKCLAWTGQQQEPRAWSQGLPTCPCSLQQGQQDPRFKSSRGGRWGAHVSMLHSASPNQHGAGVRCLYNSQNQLIEGRQERYWRSSRQASPYRDQELKLYDWCCNRAGSAHLCARYSEKRPKIGCDGYQSPSVDSSEEAENYSDEQIDGEDK